jgi:hypothetical protein
VNFVRSSLTDSSIIRFSSCAPRNSKTAAPAITMAGTTNDVLAINQAFAARDSDRMLSVAGALSARRGSLTVAIYTPKNFAETV